MLPFAPSSVSRFSVHILQHPVSRPIVELLVSQNGVQSVSKYRKLPSASPRGTRALWYTTFRTSAMPHAQLPKQTMASLPASVTKHYRSRPNIDPDPYACSENAQHFFRVQPPPAPSHFPRWWCTVCCVFSSWHTQAHRMCRTVTCVRTPCGRIFEALKMLRKTMGQPDPLWDQNWNCRKVDM